MPLCDKLHSAGARGRTFSLPVKPRRARDGRNRRNGEGLFGDVHQRLVQRGAGDAEHAGVGQAEF